MAITAPRLPFALSVALPRLPPWRIALSLAVVYVVWSSTYFAMHILVAAAPALLSGGARFITAGLVLLVIGRVRGAAWPRLSDWLRAAPAGLFLFVGGNGLVALAVRSAPSGLAALACALAPVWAAVLALPFGQRPGRLQWLGFALGFAGVAALCMDGTMPDAATAALLAVSPVCWAAGTLLSRRATTAGTSTPHLPSLQLVTGGIGLLVLGFGMGEHVPASIDASAALAWLYLVVPGSIIGFSAFAYLVRNASTPVAMSYAYVNPVLALVLGALAGGEALGGPVLVAAALVVAAVVLIVKRPAATIVAVKA